MNDMKHSEDLDMEQSENSDTGKLSSYYALLVAFKSMNERCGQLERRLASVEEENMRLRLECGKVGSAVITETTGDNEEKIVQTLKEKVEELTKQKSQLSYQIFMVEAENRQLWNRLTKLARINKSLGEKEQSLEEISLRLINSIMLEKSDLEQQYDEMVKLQNNTEVNLQHIGFTYPESSDTDLEILKQHDSKLIQIKNTLLSQQTKLKRALRHFQKMKEGAMCNNCRMNASKKMCQAGTQFDSDESFKEHGATQTSLQTLNLPSEKCSSSGDSVDRDNKICPLCGSFYGKDRPFEEFHEHVLSHFNKNVSIDGFEIVH
ncbi:C2H2-type zinc binding domain-containing protein spindle-F isoform X2 [Lasioglossum baleicum]|uniref:C2H2-type zinc binding domain-containing protein spindle-F isoform X2 n=1 Tax=Lasioglossum baleicum TaxID=434251 RepID=UPI003FCC5C02